MRSTHKHPLTSAVRGVASDGVAKRRFERPSVTVCATAMLLLACASPPCPREIPTVSPESGQDLATVECRVAERVLQVLIDQDPSKSYVISPHAITRALVLVALMGGEGNPAILSTVDARVATATQMFEEVREVHEYAGNPLAVTFGTLAGSFSRVAVRATLDDYEIGGFRNGIEVLFAFPRAGLRSSCPPTASCFGELQPGSSTATVRIPQFALESVLDLRNMAEPLGITALFKREDGADVAFSSISVPARLSYELTINKPRTIDNVMVGTLDHGVARKNELVIDRPFRVIVREPTIGVILYSAWITGSWKPAAACRASTCSVTSEQ